MLPIKKFSSIPFFFCILCIWACGNGPQKSGNYTEKAATLVKWNKALTDVIVQDIFTPPVAGRIYAYPNIAAYEVLIQKYPEYASMVGQVNGLDAIPKIEDPNTINFEVAAMAAFATVAKKLVYSEHLLDSFEINYHKEVREQGVSEDLVKASVAYGQEVGTAVINWANSDNYNATRKLTRYVLKDEPGAWKPTTPDYMPAIEPNWNKLRPFTLDSAGQFMPELPPEFSEDTGSVFYKRMLQVQDAVVNTSDEKKAIADFWDCNPNISHHHGHMMFYTQKITPGGHWMGISKIAIENSEADLMRASQTFTMVSVAMFDAFISCWDTKYKTNYIRPVTVINDLLDHKWEPVLQTPAFPEYTSGHSVVSAAASTVLTDLYGDSFAFIDSTEYEYGLEPRTFKSFIDAADEAAISRLYGGIHYIEAIENGVIQGKQVGNNVLQKIKSKK